MKINEDQFTKLVINSNLPVLVYFYTDWCRYCKTMSTVVDKLSENTDGKFKVYKVNADECKNLSNVYSITALPTCLIFNGGSVSDTLRGHQSYNDLLNKMM